jgi:hypothetical protein
MSRDLTCGGDNDDESDFHLAPSVGGTITSAGTLVSLYRADEAARESARRLHGIRRDGDYSAKRRDALMSRTARRPIPRDRIRF